MKHFFWFLVILVLVIESENLFIIYFLPFFKNDKLWMFNWVIFRLILIDGLCSGAVVDAGALPGCRVASPRGGLYPRGARQESRGRGQDHPHRPPRGKLLYLYISVLMKHKIFRLSRIWYDTVWLSVPFTGNWQGWGFRSVIRSSPFWSYPDPKLFFSNTDPGSDPTKTVQWILLNWLMFSFNETIFCLASIVPYEGSGFTYRGYHVKHSL